MRGFQKCITLGSRTSGSAHEVAGGWVGGVGWGGWVGGWVVCSIIVSLQSSLELEFGLWSWSLDFGVRLDLDWTSA